MIEIVAAEDRVVYVRASGKLDLADYRKAAPELSRLLRDRRSRRLLLDLEGFTGWTLPALLRELSLLTRYPGRFERVAVKGAGRVVRRLLGAPWARRLAGGSVRFFDGSEDAEARTWITEGLIQWSRPLSAPASNRNDLVDVASEESFPASDPPGYTPARL